MSRKSLLAVAPIALAATLGTVWPGSQFKTQAATHTERYKAAGWTMALTSAQKAYGLTFTGNLTHNGKTYMVQGDWIPAGDAGGDLLRIYGTPFGTVKGLVSVATLYSTCEPNCAAARKVVLAPLGSPSEADWSLPGMTNHKSVTLTIQG
jgi:hypothetical protein